mgnify:CR=1 FL=1
MKPRVFTKGFNALLVTQFLGAANDNLLKQLIALQLVAPGIWAGAMGDGGQGAITVIFTLPFLLLSGWSGQLADRISKQQLSQWVKIAEVFIAVIALAALWKGSLLFSVTALVLLSIQSTVFGPAKYGMIPEMMDKEALGPANGAINMLTNIAIIVGGALGGVISDQYAGFTLLPGLVILVVAVAGTISSRYLQPLESSDPSSRVRGFPFSPYVSAFCMMAKVRHLVPYALAWGFFYFVGVTVLQVNLDFKPLLNLTDTQASLLNVPLVVGIGLGSGLAGCFCKEKIRMGLVPLGGIGIAVMLIALGSIQLTYIIVMAGLVLMGAFAGLYIVPLQSKVQELSPEGQRGRVLGTSNFLTFAFVALGGAFYWLMRSQLAIGAQVMLVISAVMLILCVVWITGVIRRAAVTSSERAVKRDG